MGRIPDSFEDLFNEIRQLSADYKYRGLSMDTMASAFAAAASANSFMASNPYIQNTRIKGISSKPIWRDRDDIEKMLKSPL